MIVLALLIHAVTEAREYHVSHQGNYSGSGTESDPLKTISLAARLAMPGDVIIVHAGVYRELIVPPRGGNSDKERITYRAAEGEVAVIKGSEILKGWINDQLGANHGIKR